MNLNIEWTAVALQSLSEVIDYTFEVFGERQVQKLLSQIYKVTGQLATFPYIGKVDEFCSEELGIEYRRILVISEISLLYIVAGNTVFIEYVKNARQDDVTIWEKLNIKE